METFYDKDQDIVGISYREGPARRTEFYSDGRFVEFGSDGSVMGLEFQNVSCGVTLESLPINEYEVAHALMAEGITVSGFFTAEGNSRQRRIMFGRPMKTFSWQSTSNFRPNDAVAN
jgi:uncharacterized protein YuzE